MRYRWKYRNIHKILKLCNYVEVAEETTIIQYLYVRKTTLTLNPVS